MAGFATDNDPYFALGTGYKVAANDDFLDRLERIAIGNCPSDDSKWCPHYQGLIRTDLFFNYPIFAAFGRGIDAAGGAAFATPPFVATAARAALAAMTTGFVLAIILFLAAAAVLAPAMRATLGVIVLAAGPVMMVGEAFAFRQPEIVTSLTWSRLAIYAAALVVLVGLSFVAPMRRSIERLGRYAAGLGPARLVLAGIVLVVAAIAARLAGGGIPLPTVAGIAGFAALFVVAATLGETGRLAGTSVGFVLFLVIAPSYFLWPVMPHAARCNIYLAMAPLLAALALRPNGRVVWLLPALAIFHLSVAGLIATALFGVELVACLIRRRATLLLAVSFVLALAVRLYSAIEFRGFGAGTDVATVLRTVLASDRLLPAAIYSCGLAAAALTLLVHRDKRWHAAGRILLLVAVVAAVSQVTPILDLAGFTFFDPGMAALILAPSYLAPAVTLGSILVLVAGVAAAPSAGTDHRSRRSAAGVLAVTAVALLAVVRVEGRGVAPSQWVTQLTSAAREIANFSPDLPEDPPLLRLAGNDDRYMLRSGFNPMNDVLTYLSLLKYKVRSGAGLFNEGGATIDNIDGTLPENRPLP